jgi:hypothetical protein
VASFFNPFSVLYTSGKVIDDMMSKRIWIRGGQGQGVDKGD